MTLFNVFLGKAAARRRAVAVASMLCVARLAAGQPLLLNEQQVFTTPLADDGDFLGRAVAISGNGNTMAVAAPRNGSIAYWSSDLGAVYVFERNPATGAWAEQARLDSGGRWEDRPDHFGAALALSDDGNTLVVGAPAWDEAHIFQRTEADWTRTEVLNVGDNQFGASVAIRGSTILVGAPRAQGPASTGSGVVHVFRWSSEVWTRTAILDSAEGKSEDQFGGSIAIDEDENTIIVGAPGKSEPWDACRGGSGLSARGCHNGAAYVFELDSSGQWELVLRLFPSPAGNLRGYDYFGRSVSISRGTAVVGAPGDQTASTIQGGAVYVFTQSAAWHQTAVLTSSSPALLDDFGDAVAVWGTNIVVGAPGRDESCPPVQVNSCNSGSAHLFQLIGGTWSEQAKLLPRDNRLILNFGAALSMIGTHVAIGAPASGTGDGRAYAFNLGPAPDLSETFVSEPPASVSVGNTFAVLDVVWNGGATGTTRTTRTHYYLSVDRRRDALDGYLGTSRVIGLLAPGALSMGSPGAFGLVTVPVIKQGSYYLLACADATHVVVESDESNNCIASNGKVAVSGADLTVTSLSSPPATALLGSTFAIADTVTNIGNLPAGPSTVRYYFSSDPILDSSDLQFSSGRGMSGLGAGDSSVGTHHVLRIPPLPAGYYFLFACADEDDAVLETDEANNCRRSSTRTNISGPNVTVTSIGNPPATAVFGATFIANDTVRNLSTSSAGITLTRFYLSLDTNKDAIDSRLSGSRTVTALGSWGTSSGSTSVQIPAMSSGTYFLLACADDLEVVAEIDEQDNCLASATRVTVGGPDLTENWITNPPASAVIGSGISISDRVTNQGNLAAGVFTIRYYLSYNTTRGPDDILLGGSRSLGGLAAGVSSTASATVLVPSMPSGSYFVFACADDLGVVAEAAEDNNCVASQTTIVVSGPDLIISEVSSPPSSAVRGMTFTITDTLFNLGDAQASTSTVRYFLSLNGMIDVTDRSVGSRTAFGALGPWTSTTGNGTAAIPPTMPLATYYLLACADDGNQVIERIENNNCKVAGNLITVQ